MSVIQKRLMPWIVDTGRFSSRQKGSLPRNGLQEHVYCLLTAIRDFMHSSGKLFVCFLDIKDAFGSLNHDFMIHSLIDAGYPDLYVELTKNIYDHSSFRVKTGSGMTDVIQRGKGIIQGCPWSIICFQQSIDKWLRWIDCAYVCTHIPAPIQGFVDDMALVPKTDDELQTMGNKSDQFLTITGMDLKHRKCAILHGQRSGNNWVKNSSTVNTRVVIQNGVIPLRAKGQTYPYLGYAVSIDMCTTQVHDLICKFVNTLSKVNNSQLPSSAKLEAINTMCISLLNFPMPNLLFLEKDLAYLENQIVDGVRLALSLNQSTTSCYFFIPKSQGGLGILSPKLLYYTSHLCFYLNCLNSNDINVQNTARQSLHLHMSKRKAVLAGDDEQSFGGYLVEDGKIKKGSKVNWPKSDWQHLFEMCQREGIKLVRSVVTGMYGFSVSSDDVMFTMTSPFEFKFHFKTMFYTKLTECFKEKKSQGRVFREAGDSISHAMSSKCIFNKKLSDKLTSFIVKGRMQLLECNSLLHIWYPQTYTKQCKLCNNPSDTVSHVLNGCTGFNLMYQARHNRVVDLIFDKIVSANKSHVCYKDSVLTPQVIDPMSELRSFQHRHVRPDIVVIDRESKSVVITEIAVPFDAFLPVTYDSKFKKYYPLCSEVGQLGYSATIVVLIIGSLGSVHCKFVPGLMKNNVSKAESKYLAQYCSTSAVIGSHRVWMSRCKRLNQ